ncbi:MAG: maleylpyruvate isomerase family mycothiol-dependent enzyme [Chloroflexota bacterium]
MDIEMAARRDQGLRYQDAVASSIAETAGALDRRGWATPTNCPPWDVTMLIAHMARGAESFMNIVQNGLQGVTEITQTREEREQRQAELASLSHADLLAAFQHNQRELRALLAGLSSGDLDRPGRHPWGLQPLWWFVDQRLAELAFHHWDLAHSLGRDREIDAEVAQHLFPTLIERNVKAFYRPVATNHAAWVIRANDLANGSWLVEPEVDGVTMTRKPAQGDSIIEGDAAALIRWFYGRASIDQLEQAGRVSVNGDRTGISSWHELFPAP